MLRVRLDGCDQRDGLLWFDGELLSGVAAEVAGWVDPLLRRGTVLLWEYREGRRVGPWVEPDLGGSKDLLLAADELDQAVGDPDFEFGWEPEYTVDRERFTGVAVIFDGPYVRGMEALFDGLPQVSRSVYWSRDGGLDDFQGWDSIPHGDRAIQVQQGWSFGRVPAYSIAFAEQLTLTFGSGDWELSGSGAFRRDAFDDPRKVFSSLTIGKDDRGRLCSVASNDGGFFELAAAFAPLVALRGDHVTSVADFSRLELAPVLDLSVPESFLLQLIEGTRGTEWFDPVRDLKLSPGDLGRGVIEWFAGLPGLDQVEIRSLDRSEVIEEVFGRLRPDIALIHHGRVLAD